MAPVVAKLLLPVVLMMLVFSAVLSAARPLAAEESLPETAIFPTARNLQKIIKNRQENCSCQLTDREMPPGQFGQGN
jgi:hypothetical protein